MRTGLSAATLTRSTGTPTTRSRNRLRPIVAEGGVSELDKHVEVTVASRFAPQPRSEHTEAGHAELGADLLAVLFHTADDGFRVSHGAHFTSFTFFEYIGPLSQRPHRSKRSPHCDFGPTGIL